MVVKQHLHAMAYGSRYIWAALWDIVHPKYISDGSEVPPESESMMAHELQGLGACALVGWDEMER